MLRSYKLFNASSCRGGEIVLSSINTTCEACLKSKQLGYGLGRLDLGLDQFHAYHNSKTKNLPIGYRVDEGE